MPAGPTALDRHDLGDRSVAMEDQDRPAAPDVIQVSRQVVFEIRDLGFHMAMLAMLEATVNATRGSSTTPHTPHSLGA
jgi:hypothetical protein